MTRQAAPPSVRVRTPGKVNLCLAVGPAGADGYHRLATVFQAVSVYEDVVATADSAFSVTVEGRDADRVPLDDTNLALRAARTLAERAKVTRGVRLHIAKQVPVAGGMAGGSADAAAALVACDMVWGLNSARSTLMEVASELGSDVPFALLGHTALGLGRGEQLTPALARGQYHWVFALCARGLPTPDVYARFDERAAAAGSIDEPEVPEGLMAALRAGDDRALGAALRNDLQPAACDLVPELHDVLRLAEREGALGAIVSGSGPTVAVLARSPQHQLDLAIALTASGVCADAVRAVGPVAGTRVIEAVSGWPPDSRGPRAGGPRRAQLFEPTAGVGESAKSRHPAGGTWRGLSRNGDR